MLLRRQHHFFLSLKSRPLESASLMQSMHLRPLGVLYRRRTLLHSGHRPCVPFRFDRSERLSNLSFLIHPRSRFGTCWQLAQSAGSSESGPTGFPHRKQQASLCSFICYFKVSSDLITLPVRVPVRGLTVRVDHQLQVVERGNRGVLVVDSAAR
jgi:hypothetical protein